MRQEPVTWQGCCKLQSLTPMSFASWSPCEDTNYHPCTQTGALTAPAPRSPRWSTPNPAAHLLFSKRGYNYVLLLLRKLTAFQFVTSVQIPGLEHRSSQPGSSRLFPVSLPPPRRTLVWNRDLRARELHAAVLPVVPLLGDLPVLCAVNSIFFFLWRWHPYPHPTCP